MGDRKCRLANRCAVMAARVGLTGGIGSGKSTVANLFKQLGVDTIDADLISRELTRPGTPEFEQIVESLGSGIIDNSGHIDRKKLGEIVFRNDKKRDLLESILHPPILDKMFDQCRKSKSPYCILEIPLLIESGQHELMDRVVVVTCNPETRTSRLQQHRKMSVDEINRVLDTQLSDRERAAKADDVIVNDSTIAALEAQVTRLHETYRSMFGPKMDQQIRRAGRWS